MTPERFKEEYGKRMPSFKNLLDTYFTEVTTVDARDYKEHMSSGHDITIFDEVPTPIKERVIHKDPDTGAYLSEEPAQYVSENFSSPTIFIGHTSAVIGASLGSKLDWYCLCLDRHAHHIKTDHAIFKGPFKTDITLNNLPTPDGVFRAFDGQDVPKEIPMWEVDREGYMEGKGFRVGMVARGWGFEDSPNAEVVSSGVCSKQKTAVALGRHGNFFLWGFAGSPDYMTDESKIVFANAIVYTHKHKDDKIIARKYNERIATKIYIDELLYYTTEPSYKDHVRFYEEINKSNAKQKQEAEKKLANGEELSEMEEFMLNSKPEKINSREEYIKNYIGRNSWSSITGFDTLAIRKYLNENRAYFYSEPKGFYELKVDEDIKSLGLANTDIKTLDKAISMFENNVEVDKVYRILMRYTLEDFSKASEWRDWYEKNKNNMFFTEAGGYVWMVNDLNANPKIRPRNEADFDSKSNN
jgi:hypothetical protein